MLKILKNIFKKNTIHYAELVKNGAIILDVRSKSEYEKGHIKNAINIPVNELENQLLLLKDKDKVMITCCASGVRSALAKNILKRNLYTKVYNGGAWTSLQKKL
ncbi:rhodanese-like domain-containing protein [Elizabethkingia sp. JS20170427COW]|uniref:rhodanese-like domain-containing protein n=1 Tax=Elizabethkingia sp. JS20170427COW TaxID=2583851 RepID=UPI001110C1F7|nr:rhodanese-like domain-containing protein [Elizabethkingia sp. JS20170427COW]QCX53744.1 rhodanese-like domain-containing protein [Elizabethkingia sp. JS20170427COW]